MGVEIVRVEWGKPPDLEKNYRYIAMEGDLRGWKVTYDSWKTTTLEDHVAMTWKC